MAVKPLDYPTSLSDEVPPLLTSTNGALRRPLTYDNLTIHLTPTIPSEPLNELIKPDK